MRKIFSALLALVMLMGAVFMLASCGAKPELDLETAEKNLTDKEYTVKYAKDEDDKDPEIVAKLTASKVNGEDDTDYITITEYTDTAMAKLAYEEMKASYEYYIDNYEREIKYMEKYLKLYEDALDSDEVDEMKEEIKDLEKELEQMKEDSVFGRSGKFVWSGTKAALDASKGK